MTLHYDFDIFDVIPGADPSDSMLDGFLKRIGFAADPSSERVALFRDPRTAEALATAPQALRDYFLASGFGLNTFASGAAKGCYPAKDEDARLEIIRRLTEHTAEFDLPRPEDYPEGGTIFRLGEFLNALATARPVDATARPAPVEPADPVTAALRSLPGQAAAEGLAASSRKFWQSRYFRAAAVMVFSVGMSQSVGGTWSAAFAAL